MIYKETGARIFWLLYDIAPLTGGCHYSWDCKKYMDKCGKCPQLFFKKENDVTRKNWNYKKKYLENIDISSLVASEWLYKKALESSLFDEKPVYKWMIPIEKKFHYTDKDKMKK